MLLGVALITLLSVLDEGRGAFGEWWVTLLTRALGWGRFAVPLVLVIPSLWLLTSDSLAAS